MILLNGIEGSDLVRARVKRERGAKCLLAFSCGKDSIAAWLALRADGFEWLPYFQYLVPGLGFVERSLRYYEEFFGQRIRRVPHPSLYRYLNKMVYMPPERCAIVEAWSLPVFDHQELQEAVLDSAGWPEGTWCATGVRAADSLDRRRHFQQHGAINAKGKVFYPVWDWQKEDLRLALVAAGVKIPVDYQIFGRSFDGLHHDYLAPIQKYFPEDFAKILEWFPLAELELKRAEYSTANYEN